MKLLEIVTNQRPMFANWSVGIPGVISVGSNGVQTGHNAGGTTLGRGTAGGSTSGGGISLGPAGPQIGGSGFTTVNPGTLVDHVIGTDIGGQNSNHQNLLGTAGIAVDNTIGSDFSGTNASHRTIVGSNTGFGGTSGFSYLVDAGVIGGLALGGAAAAGAFSSPAAVAEDYGYDLSASEAGLETTSTGAVDVTTYADYGTAEVVSSPGADVTAENAYVDASTGAISPAAATPPPAPDGFWAGLGKNAATTAVLGASAGIVSNLNGKKGDASAPSGGKGGGTVGGTNNITVPGSSGTGNGIGADLGNLLGSLFGGGGSTTTQTTGSSAPAMVALAVVGVLLIRKYK